MSNVDEIKDRLNILDVVSQYVELHKAGKHYKGKSPFTNEKTPSFFVSPDRGMYYCFSSGKGGDVFTFIQEMEGLDFYGSLKVLAERAGVELQPENKEARTERDELYRMLEEAKDFFKKNLSAEARTYLHERGITDVSIDAWELGLALPEWRSLMEYLEKKGHTPEMMLRAGLIKETQQKDKRYDTFRSRIMFPIFDSAGRTVAFSGRIFGEGAQDGVAPKYVNSPETELFNKSRILYGYDRARQTMRKLDFSVVVEGQMDLVLSHQAGYTNTVASSGTALSSEHIVLISRLSSNVVFGFDGDKAGVESTKRASMLALRSGMDAKIALLPEGVDPADLINKDPALWKEAIKKAQHVVEFLTEVIARETKDERKLKLRIQREVLPFVAAIDNKIDQEHFIEFVAERLSVSKDSVRNEVSRAVHSAEETLSKTESEEISPEVLKEEHKKDRIAADLYIILLWQKEQDSPQIDVDKLENDLKETLGEETFVTLSDISKDEQNKAIFTVESIYAIDEKAEDGIIGTGTMERHLDKDVEELLYFLRKETLTARLSSITEKLRKAEGEGDAEKTNTLLKESQEISQKIATLTLPATES